MADIRTEQPADTGAGLAAEVLPFPIGHDGAFWGFYWWGQRPGARWASGPIVPAKGLDPVEGALAVTGPVWNGLPVAGRALATWGRIADITSGWFLRIRHARWPQP